MAEDIVVKEVLTDEMKRDGAALTRALDEAGWPVVASFWYYESDDNFWKLMLASPRVSTYGQRDGYGAVIRALDALHESRKKLKHITVVEPNNAIVKALASEVQTGWTIVGKLHTARAIDGRYIDDAFLYRITSEPAAA
ncbi:MAG TPA: hypothetical protein VN380_15660 [Thermoanaerobaculia bacterium]|jgi:hypothetical protein|nr:hypothetical protein [Thermoanaerobaculia bacterium]